MTSPTNEGAPPFGHTLRAKRIEKKFGLREFAALAGVSPTYLSQIEQCNAPPPTADRVRRMAELLGVNADEWIVLAGRVPEEISRLMAEHPAEVPDLLRAVRGLTPEQFRKLRAYIGRMRIEKD